MGTQPSASTVARRSFLSRFGAGVTAFGAAFGSRSVAAVPQAPQGGPNWQPARHAADDWMDELTGIHRFVFDNVSTEGFNWALTYANNFIDVNGNAYGLDTSDVAVIVIARHNSTPLSYNDAMWKKYGEAFAQRNGIVDPETNAAPVRNIQGSRLAALFEKGLHLAVCAVASRGFARVAAEAGGGDPDEIFEEIAANLLPNAHMTAAGIVAVNRAQERGYTFSFTAG